VEVITRVLHIEIREFGCTVVKDSSV